MNKTFIKLFILVAFITSSCETIDLDQTDNPSTVSSDLLNPTFAFNYVQLQLPNFVDETNQFTQRVTRQMAMTGGNTYDNAFAPVNFNSHWSAGFNILNAVKTMEPKAIETNNNYALGASKVIRCYILMTFVDMYGKIPYSEALQGSANITPKFDNDEVVYESVLNELDAAIEILKLPTPGTAIVQDLYYSSQSSWIKLANTLKLKMYNNCNRLTTVGSKNVAAEMNAIITDGNYITVPADDFVFKYGNSRFTPNTRHPLYNDQYEAGGGAYLGNYFMWAMTTEKGSSGIYSNPIFPNTIGDPGDPRVPYYFFRQDADPGNEDTFTVPGRTRPEHYNNIKYNSFFVNIIRTPYTVSNWFVGGIAADGFLGRDHGNNTGIPPDANVRTVAGVYPIGGMYGSATSVQTNGNKGKLGAGIMPILLSSFVHFMKAEAMQRNIIAGNPQAELETAVTQSITKTTTLFADYPVLSTAQQTTLANKKQKYIDFINAVFSSENNDRKLELIIKEYYLASWGNGIEPYNNYRRTGYPSNFQPTLEPESGAFFNCALYSGNAVNNNPNTPENDRRRKVFWAVPNETELH